MGAGPGRDMPIRRRLLLTLVAVAPVAAQDGARPVYFVRDVAPIFDREGCSGGACHGKIGGQGKLAISLMTLAPTMDHAPLEPFVNVQQPEQSPLLQKPTMQTPHSGGQRFDLKSDEYETILKWIQQGCLNPTKEPLPVSLAVSPERFVFSPEARRFEIKVTATFADGTTEEVTDRTRFISQDDNIVTVNPRGQVRPERWGSTAVVCRYVGLIKPVFVSLPRPAEAGEPAHTPLPVANMIDTLVGRNLEWLNLQPSERCDDHTFLRRIHLDLVGALPTPDEIAAFVGDTAADKRVRKIDALLADPRFVNVRTLRLGDMLRVNPQKLANGPLQQRAAMVFDDWIRQTVRDNVPFDQFTKQLVTATGSTMQSGPANFYRVERTPQDRAETIGQAFLGIRLSCARCHNHPFDRWTTDDYWQFAAFCAKVVERGGELYNEGVIYRDNARRLNNQSVTSPRRGQQAVPTLLGGEALPNEFQGDFVEAMADWMIADDNPYFAVAAVNRVWSHLFGRGVIHPVDDIRETSVPSVPALLAVLAKEFRGQGYDVKWLIREICRSETYQRASDTNATNQLDDRYFSHWMPKQMMAQVMLDAINSACGTADRFGTFPLGTTAVELPLPIPNGFLDRFGRSQREFLANLDPHVEPTLPQTLHLINSGFINGKVASGNGTVATLERAVSDNTELVTQLYLRTLSRPPTAVELEDVLRYVGQLPNRREAFEDLLWALLCSREFVFIS